MESFLFRSYYFCVKGKASDLPELESEMRRIASFDPDCVEWHLRSKHISQWLRYIGETRLANRVATAKGVEDAVKIVKLTNSRRKPASKSRKRKTSPRSVKR